MHLITFIGLRQDLAIAREGQLDNSGLGTSNDKFKVPYQRNVNFTGRQNLLATLHSKLREVVPGAWNHRVALYGLGGVGKTQLALEYVYSHKDDYERVYWISAVSQATLFSGFRDIAEQTQCVPGIKNLEPPVVVKKVLEWLNVQPSWLLIIDNLDNIEVIDGYLPEQSPSRHTLITTRNPYCDHIPAEGLKVGDLEVDDATKLLLVRSRIGPANHQKQKLRQPKSSKNLVISHLR